jgi:hypothetical protein
MTVTAESLARSLGGRRNGHGGWRAKCPSHNDNDPSFDITTGESGKVVFICRAGCTNDQVLDALKRRGLWPEREASHGRNGANGHATDASLPPHPQFGAPDHRFDYYDRNGHLIGAVCRWNRRDRKEIRPASFDGAKWAWQGFAKPTPLYRLADILKQPNRPVLVVEGEKAAEAAREVAGDITVTTWAHGASAVAQADWSPLKARDVVLWPDADEPGHNAMREAGAALRKAGAHSIRLVKLPDGLPKGWDIADTIPETLDVDNLIKEARDIAAERVAQLGIKSAADLMAREFQPLKMAVPDLIPEGCGLLAGKPKTGKSWLALDCAIAVAGGGYAIGNILCAQGDVLYLALEDTDRRLQGRIRAVLQGAPVPAALCYATEWRRADEGGLEDLRTWLATHPRARLVIIDTLQKIRGARKRDAGIYEEDYRVVAEFKRLADEFTVPIVLVHHLNKEGNSDPVMAVSGTAGITGSADTILVIKREPNDANAILYVRGRDVNEAEVAIRFDNETGRWLKLGKADDWRITEERRAIVRALTDNGGPMFPKEIAAAIGKKQDSVRFLLFKMAKDGTVTKLADGRYSP